MMFWGSQLGEQAGRWSPLSRAFDQLLERYLRALIPRGVRVLEVGCGNGDRLASVCPSRGLGIEADRDLVALARGRHPDLDFRMAEPTELRGVERFDYILLVGVLRRGCDVQLLLEQLRELVHSKSRVVVASFNRLWRPLFRLAGAAGLVRKGKEGTWFSASDLQNLFHLAGWEVIRSEKRMLWPLQTPGIAPALNRWLAPLPILQHLCLVSLVTARLQRTRAHRRSYTCSVLIPARNEVGNIESAVRRMPTLGRSTEIIFIEGHSEDSTWEEIQQVTAAHPDRKIVAFRQTGTGKGAAIREGCARATGDLLFILDADLTVAPKELAKFYEVVCSGTADVVNGVRLVYPLSEGAMRCLNRIANHCFGLFFSWLLGQRIRDTLCGTKVLFRSDYEAIAQLRPAFGELDPFGDFDLLFGAAKRNLRVVDLPVRYGARSYGTSNIRRWRHGWLLLRVAWVGACRLKFI